MSTENILIFRIGHLGDTVIALPALWEIRRNFPAARLSLLTNFDAKNPKYISPRDVLPENGLIDDFIAYPTNLGTIGRYFAFFRSWQKLRRGRYDLLIYLMPRVRTDQQIDRDLRYFLSAGISHIIGADHIRTHSLPMSIPRPTPAVQSESDFLLELLESNGLIVSRDSISTDLGLSQRERGAVALFLENAGAPPTSSRMIAVTPGSKWKSKVWAEERFGSVVGDLLRTGNYVPVVFGAEDDRAAGERLISGWGKGINAAGKLTVRESAALLESCCLYLGNDTGTMHLAAAVGTPCVAIFAAIDWRERWSPIGDKHIVFRKSVECEGCLTPNCPFNNKCLDMVSENEVYEACLEILRKADD